MCVLSAVGRIVWAVRGALDSWCGLSRRSIDPDTDVGVVTVLKLLVLL